jgi:hypothetical protein
MLRNEGIFAPLRLRTLWCTSLAMAGLTAAQLVALAAEMASHTWLTSLGVFYARLDAPAVLDAFVDVALTLRLSDVTFASCELSPASAPSLVFLLGTGLLAQLFIDGGHEQPRLLDAAACLVLAAALRASSGLQLLTLSNVDFWHAPGIARELLGALSTHHGLEIAMFSGNDVSLAHRAAAGAALAEFVAAAPALEVLDVSECNLGDDGLGPLVDALPGKTRLFNLTCPDNGVSEAFVRDRLLPAVRANSSLRELILQLPWESAREAEALVQSRDDDD